MTREFCEGGRVKIRAREAGEPERIREISKVLYLYDLVSEGLHFTARVFVMYHHRPACTSTLPLLCIHTLYEAATILLRREVLP